MYLNILPRSSDLFSGREKELKKLKETFEESNFFYIEGISGIGKTSIMLKWANILAQNYENNILWLKCMEDWTLDTVLMEINEWLVNKGEKSSIEALTQKPLTGQEKALYIINLLNKSKYIIFLDDFQSLKEETEKIFLNTFKQYIRNTRIYIISQKSLSMKSVEHMDILRIKVKGLETEDGLLLLKKIFTFHDVDKTPDEHIIIKIIEKTKGHPFFLKTILGLIISRTSSVEYILNENIEKDIGTVIFNKLINNITPDEKNLLEILSGTRISLSPEDIREISKIEDYSELLSSLENKIFIEKDQTCRYLIHPLLKEYIWNNLDEHKKNTLHNILGEYFKENPERSREAFHHLIKAGKSERAGELFETIMNNLLSLGYYEEIIEKINVLEKYIPINQSIKRMKAVALSVQGNWKKGLVILEKLKNSVSDKHLLSEIYLSIANIHGSVRNYSSAIDYYRESLELFEETGNMEQAIYAMDKLAIIYKNSGKTEEAYRLVQKIFTAAEHENNEIYLIYALSKKITFLLEDREFEKALESSEKHLAMAEKTGTLNFIHSALANKGYALLGLKRYDEAYECFERKLISGKETGIKLTIAFSYQGLARVLYEKGNLEKASAFLEKSIEIYLSIGNKLSAAMCEYNLAAILSEKREFYDAIELYSIVMKKAAELSYKKLEIKAAIDIIKNRLKIRGDFPSSEEAIRLKKTIPEHLIEDKINISLILSLIYDRENKEKEKEDILKEALEMSEKKSYLYGITKACYIMSEISDKSKEIKEVLRKRAEENLDKLEESEKRELNSLLDDIKKLKEEYVVKIRNREFSYTLPEVNKIRKKKNEFELFIDVPGKFAFEKDRGELNIFRKTKLINLLLLLIRSNGRELSCKEIYREIWEWEYEEDVSDAEVRKCISRIRKLLEPEEKNFKYILHNQGYFGKKGKYYFNMKANFCLVDKNDL